MKGKNARRKSKEGNVEGTARARCMEGKRNDQVLIALIVLTPLRNLLLALDVVRDVPCAPAHYYEDECRGRPRAFFPRNSGLRTRTYVDGTRYGVLVHRCVSDDAVRPSG